MTGRADRKPNRCPQTQTGQQPGSDRTVQEALVGITETDVEAEHPDKGQQPHDDRSSDGIDGEPPTTQQGNHGQSEQDEWDELQHMNRSHLLEGGVQEGRGGVGRDVDRVAKRSSGSPQPDQPRQVTRRDTRGRRRQDPALGADGFPKRSAQEGPETDGAEQDSDEDRCAGGVGEHHEKREEEDRRASRPSLPGIREEPQGRRAEQQREEVVHVADERSQVQGCRRDRGHGSEDRGASSQAVSDRGDHEDQEHLPAGYEGRRQGIPIHTRHLPKQRAEEGCGDAIAATEYLERAVREDQIAGRMAREHLGPPRVPGQVGPRRNAARINHEWPQPGQRDGCGHEEHQHCVAISTKTTVSRRLSVACPDTRARPECGHRLTSERSCHRLGDGGTPR